MPVLAMRKFDYIAHVQKDGSEVIELAGTREDYNSQLVYHYLTQRAMELGGWLISNHINEHEEELPWKADTTPHHIGQVKALARVERQDTPATPSVFDDHDIFGVYYGEYKGASLCTYKETVQ